MLHHHFLGSLTVCVCFSECLCVVVRCDFYCFQNVTRAMFVERTSARDSFFCRIHKGNHTQQPNKMFGACVFKSYFEFSLMQRLSLTFVRCYITQWQMVEICKECVPLACKQLTSTTVDLCFSLTFSLLLCMRFSLIIMNVVQYVVHCHKYLSILAMLRSRSSPVALGRS